MLKRIMIFLVSILLLLNSALVNASIGGWTLSNPTAVGASILYDGTKGAATSSILISPNASQIAKVLRGGIAGYALTFAVEQLLGAVDWVLDPANNQIKYKVLAPNPKDPQNEFYYSSIFSISHSPTMQGAVDKAAAEICRQNRSYGCIGVIGSPENSTQWKVKYTWTSPTPGYATNNVTKSKNPYYDPNLKPKEKTLSLITVAQQVIENAESDNLDAQFAVLAAASNILSEAEQDDVKAKPIADELENNTKCPSGIVRSGSCWVCDKSLFMPYTRATRDAKTATRGKSCKNITDTTIKASNAVLFRNLINARVQENACWSPPDQNHATALVDAQNALSLCEN